MRYESLNRRCQIVIDKHRSDYAAAMGELNVRKNILQKRLDSGWVINRREYIQVTQEIDEITRLLNEHSKQKTND